MNRALLFSLCSLCLCGFNSLAAKPEWPRLYNQGVTAYQSNDFATAAQQFEQALSSPERDLQQRAQYNLGNVYYRQGQAQREQAQELWKKAIKQYESAIAINPQDEDAKFNRDFVKKKLEELEKQQQEQQQQKQDQQKQDQQKDDRQKQDQQQQQQEQQKKEQEKKEQQSGKDHKKQEEQKQQQQQQPNESDRQEKQQAKAMLDNLRENEQNWNFFPELQMKDLKEQGEPVKDW
jgi:Ca-activated chloride channel family protein